MTERPDIEGIRARIETINADTWGFIRADDEKWRFKGSDESVEALAELPDDAEVLLDYAASLEREVAEVREGLRAIEWDEATDVRQCAWCMAHKEWGHHDNCQFAALLAAQPALERSGDGGKA